MIWKEIDGFENYLISEYGDVFSKYINAIMKPYLTNKGYKAIDLHKNHKKYKFCIHRLVALNFIPNPNNYPIVLHLDNVKTNTHYTNLKWGTYSENNAQAVRDGIMKVPKPDNRKYYALYNDDNIEIYYGRDELMKVTEYEYSKAGLNDLIFRHEPLKSGPYSGYYMRSLTPAVSFSR